MQLERNFVAVGKFELANVAFHGNNGLLKVQKHAHDGFHTRNCPGQTRQDPTFKELLF